MNRAGFNPPTSHFIFILVYYCLSVNCGCERGLFFLSYHIFSITLLISVRLSFQTVKDFLMKNFFTFEPFVFVENEWTYLRRLIMALVTAKGNRTNIALSVEDLKLTKALAKVILAASLQRFKRNLSARTQVFKYFSLCHLRTHSWFECTWNHWNISKNLPSAPVAGCPQET